MTILIHYVCRSEGSNINTGVCVFVYTRRHLILSVTFLPANQTNTILFLFLVAAIFIFFFHCGRWIWNYKCAYLQIRCELQNDADDKSPVNDEENNCQRWKNVFFISDESFLSKRYERVRDTNQWNPKNGIPPGIFEFAYSGNHQLVDEIRE